MRYNVRMQKKTRGGKVLGKRKRKKKHNLGPVITVLLVICAIIGVAVVGWNSRNRDTQKDTDKQQVGTGNPDNVNADGETDSNAGQTPADGDGDTQAQITQEPEEGQAANGQTSEENWALILVNRDHPLPADYQIEIVQLSNGERVDARIYPSLQEMFDTMRAEGIYPVVRSGYRSYEEQEAVMEERIQRYVDNGLSQEDAKAKAETEVALPGTSEHQLGLGVDINADGVNSYGDEVYNWLYDNAHKYGFIKRYPEDKTDVTGIINEPWHYRYVGVEAATEMKESGQCLEEYLTGKGLN